MFFSRLRASLRTLRHEGYSVWRAERARPAPGKLVGVTVRGGPTLLVRPGDSDLAVVRDVFVTRKLEVWVEPMQARITAAYEALLARGAVPVVIDAGAYNGATSIWYARLYPRAVVIALEPDPANFAVMQRNLADYPAVQAVEAALGGEPGWVSIVPAGQSWGIQTERAESGCPAITVADAVARVPGGVAFIVKMNIEGFERDVFSANTEWLDDVAMVHMSPHDWMLPGEGTSLPFQREFGKRAFEMLQLYGQLCYVRFQAPGTGGDDR